MRGTAVQGCQTLKPRLFSQKRTTGGKASSVATGVTPTECALEGQRKGVFPVLQREDLRRAEAFELDPGGL